MPWYTASDVSTLHPTTVDSPLFGLACRVSAACIRVRMLQAHLLSPNPGHAALLGLKSHTHASTSGAGPLGNAGVPRNPNAPSTLTGTVHDVDPAGSWVVEAGYTNPAGALRRIAVPPAAGAWFRWTWPEGQGLVLNGSATVVPILAVVNLGTTDPGEFLFSWSWEE
jgi:hypothetical protein